MRKREEGSAGFSLLKDGTKSQYVCSVGRIILATCTPSGKASSITNAPP